MADGRGQHLKAFEKTHPTLPDAIGGVADALARMGI
jgi:hypothetical protein